MTKLISPHKLPDHGIDLRDRQRRRLEDAGLFPKRVPLSARRHAYVADEIEAYIKHKIAAARSA
jgi:hypothetical protein